MAVKGEVGAAGDAAHVKKSLDWLYESLAAEEMRSLYVVFVDRERSSAGGDDVTNKGWIKTSQKRKLSVCLVRSSLHVRG